MTPETGLCLSEGDAVLAETAEAINGILNQHGVGVWPSSFADAPADIKELLASEQLTEQENSRLKTHFLLSREKLLDAIHAAGRAPNVAGGGSLEGFCVETAIQYPQLHVIDKTLDYSGFFPLHVNVSLEGVGSDEIGQVLSGSGMTYRFGIADGRILSLTMSCPDPLSGWVFTFNGGAPHGGVLDDTAAGTKVLVQAIGPPRFNRNYTG